MNAALLPQLQKVVVVYENDRTEVFALTAPNSWDWPDTII